MQKNSWARPALFMMIVGAIAGFYLLEGDRYLSLEYIQKNLSLLQHEYELYPVKVTLIYVGIYLFMTSLSIPGSIVLTLLSGPLFGIPLGTFWVMFSTSAGACLAFLMSRYLFRAYFCNKFQRQFQKMNHRVQKEGIPYLFMLRMVPVSPYVVINVVMGLTDMKIWTFTWVTLLGMFPGTFIYILAGNKIASIRDVSEILSWEIILALSVLAFLAPLTRFFMKHYQRRLVHE